MSEPVERGKFVMRGALSGRFYIFNARRLVKDHGNGRAIFEVVGQKWDITEQAEAAFREAGWTPPSEHPVDLIRRDDHGNALEGQFHPDDPAGWDA